MTMVPHGSMRANQGWFSVGCLFVFKQHVRGTLNSRDFSIVSATLHSPVTGLKSVTGSAIFCSRWSILCLLLFFFRVSACILLHSWVNLLWSTVRVPAQMTCIWHFHMWQHTEVEASAWGTVRRAAGWFVLDGRPGVSPTPPPTQLQMALHYQYEC